MRLFTSRYQNQELARRPDLVKVGITLGKPRMPLRYEIDEYLRMLAPNPKIFHINDIFEFLPAFVEQLDKHGIDKIMYVLKQISQRHGGRDIVMLCFEDCRIKPNTDPPEMVEWCHRLIVAGYIQWKTGQNVWELENIGLPEPGQVRQIDDDLQIRFPF